MTGRCSMPVSTLTAQPRPGGQAAHIFLPSSRKVGGAAGHVRGGSGSRKAYAVRRVEFEADVADVVAEVFTTAWRRLAQIPSAPEDRLSTG
jgi:hypothetical protein